LPKLHGIVPCKPRVVGDDKTSRVVSFSRNKDESLSTSGGLAHAFPFDLQLRIASFYFRK